METKTVLQTSIKTVDKNEQFYDFTSRLVGTPVTAFGIGERTMGREVYRVNMNKQGMIFHSECMQELRETLGEFFEYASIREKVEVDKITYIAELVFEADDTTDKLLQLQKVIAQGGLYRITALQNQVRAANKDKGKFLGELTLVRSNQFDFNRQPWWVRLIKFIACGCKYNVVKSSKGE